MYAWLQISILDDCLASKKLIIHMVYFTVLIYLPMLKARTFETY